MSSGQVGYMALLRNLRNIVTKSTDKALDTTLNILTNEYRIRKAKQMPFRYLSAFLEIDKLTKETSIFEGEKAKIKKALQLWKKRW